MVIVGIDDGNASDDFNGGGKEKKDKGDGK